MSRPVAEFWFEFASTYSYLSVMRIERAAQAAGVDVAWKPFLLGPVFLALGWNDSPFNIYPPKGRYMWRDLERLAEKEGLPFRRPSRFPRNGLLAARVALVGVEEGWVAAFARAVMTANFAEDREIGEEAVIVEILATLGPASNSEAMIEKLHRAGADLFRINMSHASHDVMRSLISMIRAVEVLPLVPVTWMTGKVRCGSPRH